MLRYILPGLLQVFSSSSVHLNSEILVLVRAILNESDDFEIP